MVLGNLWNRLFKRKKRAGKKTKGATVKSRGKKIKRKPRKSPKRKPRRYAAKRIKGKTKKETVKKAPRKKKKRLKRIKQKAHKKIKKRISFKPVEGRIRERKPVKHQLRAKEKIDEEEIGVVTHYFGKISVGAVKLKAALRVGDEIHIKGVHDNFRQVVKAMQFNHKDISYAKKGLEVGIKVAQRVHENDKVYRALTKQTLFKV